MEEQQTTRPRRLPAAAAILVGAILAGGAAGGGIAAAILNGAPASGLASTPGQAETVSVDGTTTESAVVDVVNDSLPAVVTIRSTVQGRFPGQTGTGSGSGFIYDSDGLILTNHHVIDGATQLEVILADGTTYDATVVTDDASRDLAVLKVDATGLPTLPLADGEARIGQSVIAIGTALGEYDLSVTTGVISGVNRDLRANDSPFESGRGLTGVLQTDAALNPGDSGGPLLDLAGNVIGINTAVAGDAQGIGFAVPISHADDLIAEARSA